MRPLLRRVERLQRLAAFEAAARLGSFTAAGRELGIAQPAVTRQVRSLETSLGTSLFARTANRSELTSDGHRLREAVELAFATVERCLDELGTDDDVFVLASPPGFAQSLLVPYLDDIQQALGDRDLRLWLYDRDGELTDGRYDAAVRITPRRTDDTTSMTLFDERVLPVAAPGLAAALGLDVDSEPADIAEAPLLHMEASDRPWMSWADWLGHFGLVASNPRTRVTFNNYPVVLQQALAGRGVALGWRVLIDDEIAAGLLQPVGPEISSPRAYRLTWMPSATTVAPRLCALLQGVIGERALPSPGAPTRSGPGRR